MIESGVAQTGRVVAAHGRHVMVESDDGQRIQCHTRGKKTECVVGDQVRWQASADQGVVDQVLPRRNLLFRQDEFRSKSFAANLDHLLVLVAVEPMYGESALARALIAAAAADIACTLVLNKVDLAGAQAARERLAPYRDMGVPLLELSLKHDAVNALQALTPILNNRHTLVLGPSGMGKSTLINRMVPLASAAVREISTALNTGRHTTTSTTWYWLDEQRRTALIDSPGFQAFGLHHLPADRLAQWMPDLAEHAQACRFYNCTHLHEPGCGVRSAVEDGRIQASRHRIYAEIHGELSAQRW